MPTAVLEKSRRRSAAAHGSGGRSPSPRTPAAFRFCSNRGIFAQLIDDEGGRTVASVSWIEDDLRALAPMERAKRAGELLAERAQGAGIETCVFDRAGYKYHGQVKALAEGARSGGLRF